MQKKTVSLIITCRNEEKNILEMYQRIKKVFDNLPKYQYEIIFVDNNSEDNSEKIFQQITKLDKKVRAIIMSRNFGSPQPSFLAGLEYSKGDCCFLLHGDIQDPPELLPSFLEKWEQDYDVVYGIRTHRKGYGLFDNLLYKSFYYIFKKLSYLEIPLNVGDFSLIDQKIVGHLLQMDENDYYLRGLRAYVGFKQTGIEYIRDSRKHGSSTSNFWVNLYWAKTIITNFSFRPLEYISYIALIIMFLSFLFIIYNLFLFSIFGIQSPKGVPTIVFLILFLGGIQLLSLSIISEYLSKIFLEVKKRPRFIIKKILNGKIKR